MGNLTHNNKIGILGEDIACRFLMKQGYEVIDRNYWKKCGEIDIIAIKDKKIHFIEVKSVSREINPEVPYKDDSFRPEDNMHPWKLQRLSKTIQVYLLEKDISSNYEWIFDVVTVFIDIKRRVSKVCILENVIL